MEDSELKSIVNAQIRSAMGYMGGELSTQRAMAMDYYLGEPFGNEMEGRSAVISRDVAEVIEWIMPSLIRIFTSGDKAVEFEPQNEKDEPAADQETEYCNYIFYRKNEGFLILYSWFKDALLQKNGIVKAFCEKKEEITKESYQGLTDDEFAYLISDEELEPLEHTERMQEFEIAPGAKIQYRVHDVKFRRTRHSHDIVVANVPPEEFLLSARTNSPNPKKAQFACHRSRKTMSDLIEMGYDKKILETIPSEDKGPLEQEYLARRNLTDERNLDQLSQIDKSLREIWTYESYLNVDYDDDDIAEYRKVTLAGNELLDNEEFDSSPFCSLTPIILPHKFFGMSMADLVNDLQLIKSTIWRQVLDNLYLNNNSMMGVDFQNVNLDDLLSRRPGGYIRTKGPPANSLMPVVTPPLPAETFPMIEYIDNVKETRTGVGKQFQGLNADILKDANIPAIQGLLTAAEQRVEMIARIFAETGVKQLFMKIHELVRKYPNKPEVVKLTGGWVEVDPRDWKERTNMSVSVGLGSASKNQQLLAISSILADQKQVVESGGMGMIVNPENIYNALKKKAHINGFKNADEFFQDPSKAKPQQPKPDPQMAAVQAQLQIEREKRQNEQAKMGMEHQANLMDLQFKLQDSQRKNEIDQLKNQVAILKIQSDSKTNSEKHMVEIRTNDIDAQLEAISIALAEKENQRAVALDKYKADLQAMMDAHLANVQHASSMQQTELANRHKESTQLNANAVQSAKQEMRDHMSKGFEKIHQKIDSMKAKEEPEVNVEVDASGKLVSVNGKKINRKNK
jgi:hypothetical protein